MTSIAYTGNNPLGFDGWRLSDGVEPTAQPAKTARTTMAPPGAGADHERLRGMIAQMARGEESGLAALYDATAARVYGLALRITRTSASAEDVTAEVFHQCWRNAAKFDAERGTVITWLLTMCRSRAIDYLRRRDDAESHAEPELLAPPDTDEDPQQLLIDNQSHSALSQAIAELAPVQRQLIALAFYRGLSHQEIAEHCNMPLGTVKTHVRKALERLRCALADTKI